MDGDLGEASVPMIESRCVVTPVAGQSPQAYLYLPEATAGHSDSLEGSSESPWLVAHSRLQEGLLLQTLGPPACFPGASAPRLFSTSTPWCGPSASCSSLLCHLLPHHIGIITWGREGLACCEVGGRASAGTVQYSE